MGLPGRLIGLWLGGFAKIQLIRLQMKKMSSYRAFPTDFITFPLKGSIYGISTIWNGNNVEGHPVQVSYFITEAQIFIFLNFIHLFITFGCAGSSLLCRLFSGYSEQGLLFLVGHWLTMAVASLVEHRL